MTGTLLNQLQDLMLARGRRAEDVRLVNRIDRDTSGLVLISYDLATHVALGHRLAERDLRKEYRALAHGVPANPQGHWRDPIGPGPAASVRRVVRADGQDCHTEYAVEEAVSAGAGGFSRLHLVLHTGRQHQIRVHASHHGLPLVGDWVYGAPCAELPGQALHAAAMSFVHPVHGRELRVEAPLPAAFTALWDRLRGGGTLTPTALNPEQRSKLGMDGPGCV